MSRNVTDDDLGLLWDEVSGRNDPRQRFALYRLCEGDLQLIATTETAEAAGVALVELGREGEWDDCPFGLLDRAPPCERCSGSGQEPFDDHIDSSQNPWVKVTCDECKGSGFKPAGTWLIRPWLPSPRNVSNAGRMLRTARKSSTSQVVYLE